MERGNRGNRNPLGAQRGGSDNVVDVVEARGLKGAESLRRERVTGALKVGGNGLLRRLNGG